MKEYLLGSSYTGPPLTAAGEAAHRVAWRSRSVPFRVAVEPSLKPPMPIAIPETVQRVIAAFAALGDGLMADHRARRDAEQARRTAKTERRLAEMVAVAHRMGIK